MQGTLIEKLNKDSEEMRLFQQEMLILEVTELISELMEDKKIKKSELAERLGKTKGYITQLLDGRANMTLRTVSEVFYALNSSVNVSSKPLGFETHASDSNYKVTAIKFQGRKTEMSSISKPTQVDYKMAI